MDIHRPHTAVNAQPRPTAKAHRPAPGLCIDQAPPAATIHLPDDSRGPRQMGHRLRTMRVDTDVCTSVSNMPKTYLLLGGG